MSKLIKKFYTILRKPYVLICLVLLVAVLFVPDSVFAQEQTASVSDDLNGWIVNAIRLLSWLWIIPASIAGKLMTNSMAFGSAFYLDTYLFKMRQFMRTMSLYALGFIFIYKILVVFVKQEELKNLGSVIGKTALAGLLIPMSWFMIVALVDFSIIATSAVAGMPLQVMEQQWKELDGKLWCYKEVRVKANKTIDVTDINKEGNQKVLKFEDVMPKGDSVGGPMIFMGCGMLNLFDFNNLSDTATDFSDIAFYSSLKLIIAFMLILPMIILMVVNMMRIFFIWLWAMFGPLIVLDTIFGGPLTKDGAAYAKYFKASNIIGLVFQPVAVVGMMSVSMVLLLGFYNGLTGDKSDTQSEGGLNSIGFYPDGPNGAQIGTGMNSEVHMTGSLLQKSAKVWVGGILGEILMAMLVIIVMRGLMKIGFSSSEITRTTTKKMFEFGKMGMKAVPIIPTGKGAQSIGAMQIGYKQQVDKFKSRIGGAKKDQAERINQMLGLSTKGENDMTSQQEAELETYTQKDYASKNNASLTYFKKLKEFNQTHDVRWSTVKPDIEQWLSNGGYEYLKGKKPNRGFTEDKPEKMSDIWGKASGKNIVRWVNGMMDGDLKGTESDSAFINHKQNGSEIERSRFNAKNPSTE